MLSGANKEKRPIRNRSAARNEHMSGRAQAAGISRARFTVVTPLRASRHRLPLSFHKAVIVQGIAAHADCGTLIAETRCRRQRRGGPNSGPLTLTDGIESSTRTQPKQGTNKLPGYLSVRVNQKHRRASFAPFPATRQSVSCRSTPSYIYDDFRALPVAQHYTPDLQLPSCGR